MSGLQCNELHSTRRCMVKLFVPLHAVPFMACTKALNKVMQEGIPRPVVALPLSYVLALFMAPKGVEARILLFLGLARDNSGTTRGCKLSNSFAHRWQHHWSSFVFGLGLAGCQWAASWYRIQDCAERLVKTHRDSYQKGCKLAGGTPRTRYYQ